MVVGGTEGCGRQEVVGSRRLLGGQEVLGVIRGRSRPGAQEAPREVSCSRQPRKAAPGAAWGVLGCARAGGDTSTLLPEPGPGLRFEETPRSPCHHCETAREAVFCFSWNSPLAPGEEHRLPLLPN